MAEKFIRSLPTIRISDTLETALMRMAAHDDCKLTEYVRSVLEHHVFGHLASLIQEEEDCNDSRAMHGRAGKTGGRVR